MSMTGGRKDTPQRREAGGFRPPLTVSGGVLLEDGRDGRFRQMVYDLLSLETQMRAMRDQLGAELGTTGPGYAIVMAIAQLQGEAGVAVNAVARYLHVSGPFVTAEAGKLVTEGLIGKRPNTDDRRGVLLTLAPEGERRVMEIASLVRSTNDYFFGSMTAEEFAILSGVAARLSKKSADAFLRAARAV